MAPSMCFRSAFHSMRAALVLAALVLASTGALAQGPPPRIFIDPGHGGAQAGALGPGGVMEKQIALQIGAKLRTALQRTQGAIVQMTREKDQHLSLTERVGLANKRRPDLFISIHANSMPTRKLRAHSHGIETYFLSATSSGEGAQRTADRENSEGAVRGTPEQNDVLAFILADLARTGAHVDSSRLAYAVHQQLISATEATDRGVQQAPFFVLMGVESPAILVEVGFISHPVEGRRLADPEYQEQIALAIALGVKDFLGETGKREGTSVARPADP
jgi:N-acetylmuramoyl-L-alanine amidase